jgi:hypothetical protein
MGSHRVPFTLFKGQNMKVKITKGPIMHDKAERKVGEVIEMDDAAGQRLIGLGVAETTEKEATSTTPPKTGNATEPPPDVKVIVDIDKLTRDDLAQELSLMGVKFKQSASREQLAALYREKLK